MKTYTTRRSMLLKHPPQKTYTGEFTAEQILEMATEIALAQCVRDESYTIDSPRTVKMYLQCLLAGEPAERFIVLFLDNRHRVIATEALFEGTIDGANVHPREVVRRALYHNAAAIVCCHNHPSGVADPSSADIAITRRLIEALALIDTRVLDHFVVGGTTIISMAERGLL